MKRVFAVLIFLVVFFPLSALSAPVGNVTFIKGSVDLTAPGQAAKPARVGDMVNAGDVIRSKSASKAEVTFIDGGILRLAEQTRVQIEEYMLEEKILTNGVLRLFRGKIQSIVKKTAGITFGHLLKNRFEVFTPTAVAGVRGTNWFVYFVGGISGFTFQENDGYGYPLNRPDLVRPILAGQAMLVAGPDQMPVTRPATDAELGGHAADTGVEGESQGDTGSGDTGQGDAGQADTGSGDAGSGGTGLGDTGSAGSVTGDLKVADDGKTVAGLTGSRTAAGPPSTANLNPVPKTVDPNPDPTPNANPDTVRPSVALVEKPAPVVNSSSATFRFEAS
ncbi:MAG: FecR domain-containing protein, partial [Desulfobacterales bacterium]|nr:FecR domain-containing protein [Desulfobacterales bacterium]